LNAKVVSRDRNATLPPAVSTTIQLNSLGG
jgi:hypothetical protein